jgi:hypothetical protein
MKANLNSKLVAIPLLAFSNLVFATEAVPLSAADMDRVTAGAQPLFESIAGMLSTFNSDLNRLRLDEFLRLHGQLLPFCQLNPDGSVSIAQINPGNIVSTIPLTPGESVWIRQATSGGVSYTYVVRSGNVASVKLN